MGISCSTPGSSSISPTGSVEMSPYTPTSVISSPTILPVLKPRVWSLSSTAATSSRVASRRILTSMARLPSPAAWPAGGHCNRTGADASRGRGNAGGGARRGHQRGAGRPRRRDRHAAGPGLPRGAADAPGAGPRRARPRGALARHARGPRRRPRGGAGRARARARHRHPARHGARVGSGDGTRGRPGSLLAGWPHRGALQRPHGRGRAREPARGGDQDRVDPRPRRRGSRRRAQRTAALRNGRCVARWAPHGRARLRHRRFQCLLARGWSAAILEALRIPAPALPAIVDSSAVLGRLDAPGLPPIPLAALVGDQQAAMMGQLRLAPGEVKITYGTSAMLDLNAGAEPLWSTRGAYPLVLWQRGSVPTFCLEGTAITAGAAITWLRDALGVIRDAAESAALAASVPDSGGVWVVPAFQGLGTPYMDAGARAVVGGLSRATTRAHLVRAILEGIAWRCREVYDALRADVPHPAPTTLRADGGAAKNDVLLQLQADALGLPVERPAVLEAGALGAAYLAGLATGVWAGTDDLRACWRRDRLFAPRLGAAEREERFAAWQRHVSAAREAPS